MNNNKFSKFTVMLGVNPGYNGSNPDITTPDEAMAKAMPYIKECLGKNVKVEPASAVYHKGWGCPEGGEIGVLISGIFDKEYLVELNKSISLLMAHLGQSTGTVEYTDMPFPSVYIQNSYNGTEQNIHTYSGRKFNDNNEFGIHFVIETKGDIQAIGTKLQYQIESVVDKNDGYIITGFLHQSEDGRIFYEGTQNPMFAPDSQEYYDAIIRMLEEVDLPILDVQISGSGFHAGNGSSASGNLEIERDYDSTGYDDQDDMDQTPPVTPIFVFIPVETNDPENDDPENDDSENDDPEEDYPDDIEV